MSVDRLHDAYQIYSQLLHVILVACYMYEQSNNCNHVTYAGPFVKVSVTVTLCETDVLMADPSNKTFNEFKFKILIKNVMKVYEYISMFFRHFTKGNNFCEFFFPSLADIAFPN